MICGYALVSTDGHSVAVQVEELRALGAETVFRETASRARIFRAQNLRALDKLDTDDLLIVTRLDRLARLTRDLFNSLAAIACKGALFCSLGNTCADTATAHRRLILTVLGGLAEFERKLIRAGASEGLKRAMTNGVKLGRKPILTPRQRSEAKRRVKAKKESIGEIARSYNVNRWTIQRLSP